MGSAKDDRLGFSRERCISQPGNGRGLSEQQLDLDYRGVAVPLRDRMGETVGALSIIMPMQHEASADALRRVLPLLKETAQSMRNLI